MIRIEEINALAELERINWAWEPVATSEIKLKCPHPDHNDEVASASLNTEKNLWKCFGCKRKGDLVTFLALVGKVKRATILTELKTRYDIEELTGINPEKVEAWHSTLTKEKGPLYEALTARGLTDDDIRGARIGTFRGRITIPVYRSGVIVNVRRYLPGASADQIKFKNTVGHGKLEIYGRDQLDRDIIWICGGELKQIVAKRHLNRIGVGAISTTGGEGSWDNSWGTYLRGKQVYICFDIDDPGRAAAQKLAAQLGTIASSVKIVGLPLDPGKFPTGDLNDYVALEERTPADFTLLMESAAVHKGSAQKKVDLGDKEVELNQAVDAQNIGYRLGFSGVISALVTTPYAAAKTVLVSCGVDQAYCSACAVPHLDKPDAEGWRSTEVASDSEALVAIVGAPVGAKEAAIRFGCGIPKACKKHELRVVDYHSVLEARLSPELRVGIRDAEDRHHPALVVNDSPEMNTPYAMRGRLFPHPRNQQATLVLNDLAETRDSLSCFELTEEKKKQLDLFRPAKWEIISLEAKLNSIWDDFAANVSQIYGRRDLHAILDLSFHSPLMMRATKEGKRITGWINILVIGDSSQGKTETTNAYIEHFGLGERVDCKNATVPGLLGGLQQLGNAWFVSWGAIPTHDRRWVVLEELKGAPPEVFSKLTDMRSSGIAEIPKIHRRKTWARTRLAVVSNARNPRGLAAYGYGVEAIPELVGANEDVRRFDAAVAVRMNPTHVREKPEVEHAHTGELCRSLILWAWTRSEDQVEFENPELLESHAAELCAKYSEEIPLVDRGTAPQKIARIASAAAARTWSTDDGETLLVRGCHIEWAAKWLDRIYSDPDMAYDEFSVARNRAFSLRNPDSIRRHVRTKSYALSFVEGLLHTHEIVPQDIQDWNAEDRDESLRTLAFLVRQNALRREGRHYMKTPAFIALLKSLRDGVANDTKIPEDLKDHL